MTEVWTPLGRGRVVEKSASRGSTKYRVEGDGFSMWYRAEELFTNDIDLPEPEVDEDNTTELPYNPSPQHTDEEYPEEATIQPIDDIDVEDRLDPVQSLDVDSEAFQGRGASIEDKLVKLPEARVNRDSDYGRLLSDPERFARELRTSYRLASVDQSLVDHFYLMDSDKTYRTAAWKDVRAKAVRLRKSGNVTTREATPRAIFATVVGDHDTYDTVVVRSGAVAGSGSITEWACTCPWGQHAFLRQHTYIGRLCSHAYAAYMELQAATRMEYNKDIQKTKVKKREYQPVFSSIAEDYSDNDVDQAFDEDVFEGDEDEFVPDESPLEDTEDLDIQEDERSYANTDSDYRESALDDDFFGYASESPKKPFAGSGYRPPLETMTSAERAESEDEMEDVTELSKQSSLKTAGRAYSFQEQMALINEAEGDDEILRKLDLRGTHYVP